MNKKETEKFKSKLLAEKSELETELSSVGQRSSSNSKVWEPNTAGMEVDSADENEVADKFEEYEGNSGILSQLETQLSEVDAALDRIEKGTYSICEKCGKPIEKDRLEASPTARFSIKHSH
jgi:DnaK suppressor protein